MSEYPDFQEFFETVYGFRPYPWQEQLAHLLAHGKMPGVIDVPTGLGKGMSVACVVWALAKQVHSGGPRTLPQRVVHAVDRRRVADDVSTRVGQLKRHLEDPQPAGAVAPVAAALRKLAGPWQQPLEVQTVHGQSAPGSEWMRATGCSVLATTMHQVVSRLLFRGYGVSARTRSIHAGLLGVDCLLLVDEPHLSQQAIATSQAILRDQTRTGGDLGLPPSQIVMLGATVPSELVEGQSVLGLSDDDRRHPQVRLRLDSAKPVTLVRVNPPKLLDRLAQEAERAASRGARVAVMVNTVAAARSVFDQLSATGPQKTLITSRFRATDRPDLDVPAKIVVATQCLEVGVDLSFDVIVTEACPYASLVQRLGRLNRDLATGQAKAVYVHSDDKVSGGSKAVYGEEVVRETTRFLQGLAVGDTVDLSLGAQLALRPQVPVEASARPPRLATFHRGFHPTIAMTLPTPYSDVPIGAFIAGPDETQAAEVLVCWRDDPHMLPSLGPAHPAECVSVPLPALVAFLNGDKPTEVSDLEVVASISQATGRQQMTTQPWVLRDEKWQRLETAAELVPGDVVALPTSAGGYGEQGWDGTASGPVSDHSLLAISGTPVGRRRRSCVLSPATVRPLLTRREAGPEETAAALDWVRGVGQRLAEGVELDVLLSEADGFGLSLANLEVADGRVLVTVAATQTASSAPEGPHQALDEHGTQVGETAAAAVAASGLDPSVGESVVWAARTHDLGKCAGSFQRYLGNAALEPAWAKSRRTEGSLARERAYAEAVGHDPRWRHEGMSHDMVLDLGASSLEAHLVLSHHGRGRPFLPYAKQELQEAGHLASRFRRLNRHYGPWGLAYLEAVVRLSDWLASREPRHVAVTEVVARSKPVLGTPQPQTATALSGLAASPMAGWFVVAGLLAAAAETGEIGLVHWPDDGSVPSGVPVVQLKDLRTTVDALFTSPQWALMEEVAGGVRIAAKNQKLQPVELVAQHIRSADESGAWLARALMQDYMRPDGGLALPIVARANNSTFVRVANDAVAARATEEAHLALLDPDAGWGEVTCDGGLDRPFENDSVTGRTRWSVRESRWVLAPMALFGMGAFGSGAPQGFGSDTKGKKVVVPLPSEPTDLETLGFMARSASLAGQTGRWMRLASHTFGKERVWRHE